MPSFITASLNLQRDRKAIYNHRNCLVDDWSHLQKIV